MNMRRDNRDVFLQKDAGNTMVGDREPQQRLKEYGNKRKLYLKVNSLHF